MSKRSWKAEYEPKVCPRCRKTLLRLDFGPSEVAEDRKQTLCKKCVQAEAIASKGRKYRATPEGKITTIWGGLVYRTKAAKRVMKLTREELGELLRKRKCAYCGRLFLKDSARFYRVIDHVIPLAQGGDTVASNLVAACWECNHDKGDRSPDEWVMRWYE